MGIDHNDKQTEFFKMQFNIYDNTHLGRIKLRIVGKIKQLQDYITNKGRFQPLF